jgi:O-antigen ligase
MMEANPMLAEITVENPTAGGSMFREFRASATFIVALSFAEFEIIAIPIGLFFALHRKGLFERCIGWAVVIGGIVGIFVSGSCGGWVGLLASSGAFVGMWSIRKAMTHRASMAPAIVGMAGSIAFATAIGLIEFWLRAHNMVLGGGAEQASTDARWVQWAAAWPLIKANPITGHGHNRRVRYRLVNRLLRHLASG